MELVLRCLVGGLVVSLFAALGDCIQPKSLGGICAAAPAVALATLWVTVRSKGVGYTALEMRSMLAGAVAYCLYAAAVSFVVMRWKPKAIVAAAAMLPVWGGAVWAMWAFWLRGAGR